MNNSPKIEEKQYSPFNFLNEYLKDSTVNEDDINSKMKFAFDEILESRFKDKQGDYYSPESIKSKRTWMAVLPPLPCLFGTAVAGITLVVGCCVPFVFLGAPVLFLISIGAIAALICGIAATTFLFFNKFTHVDLDTVNYKNKHFCQFNASEAVADYLNSDLSYTGFMEKYRDLFKHKVLEKQDIDMLQKRDCIVLNYRQFVKKHEQIFQLNPENKQILESRNV